MLKNNTLKISKTRIEGDEKVNKKYESLQKEIDKLLWETSQEKTHKNYQEMQADKKYKSGMEKIGKLTAKLNKLEEENRENGRRKRKTYT